MFKVNYLRFTVNVMIETDRSIIHDVFYVHYVAQKVIMYIQYILQFNENTKHKFMRLYYYSSFAFCLCTKWPFMTSFCVGIDYYTNILT